MTPLKRVAPPIKGLLLHESLGKYQFGIGELGLQYYHTADGLVALGHFQVGKKVSLRLDTNLRANYMVVVVEGELDVEVAAGVYDKLKRWHYCLMNTPDFTLHFKRDGLHRILLFNVDSIMHRMEMDAFPIGRYELDTEMQQRLSDILEPRPPIPNPSQWLTEKTEDMYRGILNLFVRAEDPKTTGDRHLSLAWKVKQYLEENFGQTLYVKEIPGIFLTNGNTLNEVFSKHNGRSLNDYLNFLRVEKAKHLLVHTNMSIAEIAQVVGCNPSILGNNFRLRVHMSPLEYRKNYSYE